MKKYFLIYCGLILICVLSSFVSCTPKDKTPEIKIGVIAELTGDLPAVGASCKNAALLAVDEINAQGGIPFNGVPHRIHLFIEDNAGKAEQSAAAAQKLITRNKVSMIIGPNSTRYVLPAAEIAESSQVPLITPWSTNPKTTLDARTNEPKKYVFRACFIDPFQGRIVARFARDHFKAKTAAILYDVASDYNRDIATYFKKHFEENGGTVVASETYTTGDKDFSAQLTKISSLAPDVVFLPNYYSEIPLQVRQLKELGYKGIILGSDSWGSSELLTLCGKDCEGLYFSTHYAADAATPAATRFINEYKTRYGHIPDDVAALTFDTFGLAREAFLAANQTDRAALRDALAHISNYEGVTGTMHFEPGSGDPIKSAVIVKIVDLSFHWFANAQP